MVRHGEMMVTIQPARQKDLRRVLARCKLPADGLEQHLAAVLVARHGERVVGSAAVEPCGESGLLRSVAVLEDLRGEGLGRLLTGEALQIARERGIRRMYLLTETAEDCFRSLRFELVGRPEVPAGMRRSVQFVSACPESALAMVRDSDGERE